MFMSKQSFPKCNCRSSLDDIQSKLLNERVSPMRLIGGRTNGLRRLKTAVGSLRTYKESRNVMSIDTSYLSAYHKFGCISIKET